MLNIRNPETHRLARELAARRGESLTTAVTVGPAGAAGARAGRATQGEP